MFTVRTNRRESGSVIMIVLFFAVVLSLVLFAGVTLVVSGNRRVHQVAALKQAHYVAEKGIEEALSSPFLFQEVFESTSPIELENRKTGRYVTVARRVKVKDTKDTNYTYIIRLESKGYVSSGEQNLAERTIVCEFKQLNSDSFLGALLSNAIATSGNLNSGKVYIYLDEGIPPNTSANVYSDAEITNLAGNIPGSVFAQGKVVVNNNTSISGDVIAKGSITLNNNTKVLGKVISAEGWIDVNNNVVVQGDIVAYGADSKGYSVYLANSEVRDIYTEEGSSQVKVSPSAKYGSIGTIQGSSYPKKYEVPRQDLPDINESVKSLWKEKAEKGSVFQEGLVVNNNASFTVEGDALINGDLVLGNNAKLSIKEGSILYVTGRIDIENNASIEVLDADGDNEINLGSSLIAESYFDIKNNAIPDSVSLVALGNSTSYLRNNSVTTGAILVPNGKLEISNKAEIHGAIFAKEITKIGNNAEVYFNPLKAVVTLPPVANPSTALKLVEWVEK